MRDLIAALRAATGPGRELDARIAVLEGAEIHDGDWMLVTSFDGRPKSAVVPVPDYTGSIDAALTLVPEGLQWGVNTHPPDELFNPGGAQAFVSDMVMTEGGVYAHSDAATPALALVIAALEARA
jgi:hypothetical protein